MKIVYILPLLFIFSCLQPDEEENNVSNNHYGEYYCFDGDFFIPLIQVCDGWCNCGDCQEEENCITSQCGNNIKEYGETCDRYDFDGITCESLGFSEGSLKCSSDCQSYDTSECLNEQTDFISINGIYYQLESPTNDFLWGEAAVYCSNLNLGGFTDWRLPTISELRELIRGNPNTESGGLCGITDTCRTWDGCNFEYCNGGELYNGPADGCYWISELSGPCWSYWTDTIFDNVTTTATWEISFRNGSISWTSITGGGELYARRFVRCVR